VIEVESIPVIEFPNSNSETICALGDTQTGPLIGPDTIENCVRIHWPHLAEVDFGGFGGIHRKIAAWVEEDLPKTSVSISLKDHRQRARSMLPLGAD
jgi:hypothetical protein